MGYVFILEATNRMGNRIHISYVIQKLIPQPLPFACPFDQSSNIEKFKGGRNHLFRMDQLGNIFQPLIWDGNNANIGVDRTEPVTRYFRPGRSESIEYRGLPNIRKAHNPASKSHLSPSRKVQKVWH
jgi:hypothetical protein